MIVTRVASPLASAFTATKPPISPSSAEVDEYVTTYPVSEAPVTAGQDKVMPPGIGVVWRLEGLPGTVPAVFAVAAVRVIDHCVPSAALDRTRKRYSLPSASPLTVAAVGPAEVVTAATHVFPPSSDCWTVNPAAAATASMGAFQDSETDPTPDVTVGTAAASEEITLLRSRTAVTVAPSVERSSRPKPKPSSAVNTRRPPTVTRPAGAEARVVRGLFASGSALTSSPLACSHDEAFITSTSCSN